MKRTRRGHGPLGLACIASLALQGCGVLDVAGAAAGAAISVGGAVVSTGVKVTGKVIETAVDVAGEAAKAGKEAARATPALPEPAPAPPVP